MPVCMCVFLAARAGAARPVFYFIHWQTLALSKHTHRYTDVQYIEDLWYLHKHGQLHSVCLLSLHSVLSLTPICLSMRLFIHSLFPLPRHFSAPLSGFHFKSYLPRLITSYCYIYKFPVAVCCCSICEDSLQSCMCGWTSTSPTTGNYCCEGDPALSLNVREAKLAVSVCLLGALSASCIIWKASICPRLFTASLGQCDLSLMELFALFSTHSHAHTPKNLHTNLGAVNLHHQRHWGPTHSIRLSEFNLFPLTLTFSNGMKSGQSMIFSYRVVLHVFRSDNQS